MRTFIRSRLKQKKHHGKTVMCANDGKIFISVSNAASEYGVSRSAISKQLKNERRTASGLCFVQINGDESEDILRTMRMNRLQECCGITDMNV